MISSVKKSSVIEWTFGVELIYVRMLFWIFSMFKPKKSRDFRLIHMSLDSLKQEIKMCVPCWLSIPNPLLWTDLLIYRLKEVSSHTISPYLEPLASRHTHIKKIPKGIYIEYTKLLLSMTHIWKSAAKKIFINHKQRWLNSAECGVT